MEPILYDYEITIGSQVQKGQIETLPMMAQAEFINIVKTIAYDQRPCRVKFSFVEEIWSQIEQRWKQLEMSIEFANNACEKAS